MIYSLPMFLLLMLWPLHAETQPHPDSFQLPAKAKADFYLSQGKFKEALGIYKSVLKDETDLSSTFRGMVKAWKGIEVLDEAEEFLNEYRRSHENSSAVWYALGYLYYVKNEDRKAQEFFKQATELDPENGMAWNNWAASLVKGKHFQEALGKVRTAIGTDPKQLMFFFNLKNIFATMGEGQRFEMEYNDSLKEEGQPLAWGYGKVIARSIRQDSFNDYNKGNLTGAIAGFEKMLIIYRQIGDINGQVPALFSLGLLYEENGNIQKAQGFFRRVLSVNPDHIQAREKIKSKELRAY